MNTRDSLFAFKPRVQEVTLPDDRGTVFVRELKSSEVIAFIKDRATNLENASYKIIQQSTCDELGNLLFEPKDIGEIAKLPFRVWDEICEGILKISGIEDDTKKKQSKTENE